MPSTLAWDACAPVALGVQISLMDALFEASFSPLSSSGAP